MIHQGQGEIEIFPGIATNAQTDEFAATIALQPLDEQDTHVSLLEHLFHKIQKLLR